MWIEIPTTVRSIDILSKKNAYLEIKMNGNVLEQKKWSGFNF